ncbi:phage holin family protein [Effusibacillus pohliae]|uniref:phage holin family protein n=1 Tax=Effusibacillus pohliae TaxID=232270 RepID=UPI000371B346|nr:phage holin family protein [Effusibacillus pohliae]
MSLKEFGISASLGVIGTYFTAILGGWDAPLKALVLFMIADYATGLAAAVKQRRVNSEVMFWGGIRKGAILLVIFMGIQLDLLLGNPEPIFRTLCLYFYIAREGLSVVENLGILGLPMPAFFKNTLEQLNDKGQQQN